MGPLMTPLREMSGGRDGDRTAVSVTVATICGALLLLGWAWLNGGMA